MEQNIKQFIEEGEKEFDMKFAKINMIHRGEVAITDITGTRFPVHTESGLVTEIGGLKSIKDFISSRQISLIKMIVEEIEGMKQTINPGGALDKSLDNAHKYGYNQALDTITSKLKEIIRNVER